MSDEQNKDDEQRFREALAQVELEFAALEERLATTENELAEFRAKHGVMDKPHSTSFSLIEVRDCNNSWEPAASPPDGICPFFMQDCTCWFDSEVNIDDGSSPPAGCPLRAKARLVRLEQRKPAHSQRGVDQ